MAASWDNDFVFDGGSNRERSNATGKSQTSGTIEDWDLDILEPPPEEEDDDDEALSTSSASSSSSLFSYEKKPDDDGSHLESLLDFLNKGMVEDGQPALPRPPMLYSSYRVGKHQNLPHAPESAQGVLRWLSNLREKVRNTRAVVARPTPKLVGKRECERQPSEELQLERQIRSAEMAFCAGDVQAATRLLKVLLKQLDVLSSGDKCNLFALSIPKTLDGGGSFQERDRIDCEDLAARLGQCATRLIRLTCRICGERPAAESTSTVKVESDTFVDAADIATLRRCGFALANAAQNYENIVRSSDDEKSANYRRRAVELVVFEGLAHLALLHGSPVRCQRNCWCSSLPPLPRVAFAQFAVSPADDDELRATALADMLLDVMGYSPLTCEQLLEDKDWWALDDDEKQNFFAARVGRRSTKFPNAFFSDNEEALLLINSSRELDIKLASCVKQLPATSLSRAKAALALGIFHLRGGERLKVTVGNSPKSSPTINKHPLKEKIGMLTVPIGPQLFSSQPLSKHHHSISHHAAQSELRAAEMLLFEATCVIEQHATTEPLDLPFFACQYGADLVCVKEDLTNSVLRHKPATSYSALVCSIGYTSLRALARSLDRRSKHAYAALALEVCIAILELRSDRTERCRLQRELAVVSARQDGYDCPRYCVCVLADLDEKFSQHQQAWVREPQDDAQDSARIKGDDNYPASTLANSSRVTAPTQRKSPIGVLRKLGKNYQHDLLVWKQRCSRWYAADASALRDIHEIIFGTDLAVSRYRNFIGNMNKARTLLVGLAKRIEQRIKVANKNESPNVKLELEHVIDQAFWGLSKLALENARPVDAARLLSAALASKRRISTATRIAILSWISKAHLDTNDARSCGVALARIRRLRMTLQIRRCHKNSYYMVPSSRRKYSSAQAEGGMSRALELRMPSVLEESSCGVSSSIRSCLLCYCGPRHDAGELTTLKELASKNPLSALQCLAPTVAAVEGVVSRIGTHAGLSELARLYHLRGKVQESVSIHTHPVIDYPLRLHAFAEGQAERHNAVAKASVVETRRDEKAATASAMAHAARLANIFNFNALQQPYPCCELQCQLAACNAFRSNCAAEPKYDPQGGLSITCGRGLCTRHEKKKTSFAVHESENVVEKMAASKRHSDMSAGGNESSRCYNLRPLNNMLPPSYPNNTSKRARRRRPFLSRHYRTYLNADDVALDALSWYRHSLECFKARGDDIGVAQSASSFARLQLQRVIAPVAFDRISLAAASEVFLCVEKSQRAAHRSKRAVLDDVDAASRCALSLAALASEPILLLETYLNVAEVNLVRRDRLAAIAHWWEARELFLRLFVAGTSVPLAKKCFGDSHLLEAMSKFLERLIRFLAACDRAMINENLLLFDIFINFERDVRAVSLAHQRSSVEMNITLSSQTNEVILKYPLESSRMEALSSSWEILVESSPFLKHEPPVGVGKSTASIFENDQSEPRQHKGSDCASRSLKDVWECLVHVRMDAANHRVKTPLSRLRELRDRNRAALCILVTKMCNLRGSAENSNLMARTNDANISENLVYTIHVASTLVVYCPSTGARFITAFGRGAHQIHANGAEAPSQGTMNSAYTGPRETIVNAGQHCHVSNGLSAHSAVFVAEMATNLYSMDRSSCESKSTEFRSDACCDFLRWRRETKKMATKRIPREKIEEMREATEALHRDLAQASVVFDSISCASPHHSTVLTEPAKSKDNSSQPSCRVFIRLVCSERAQLVPWECIVEENILVTRICCGFSFFSGKETQKSPVTGKTNCIQEDVVLSQSSAMKHFEGLELDHALSWRVRKAEIRCGNAECSGNQCVDVQNFHAIVLRSLDLLTELCSRETLALVTLASIDSKYMNRYETRLISSSYHKASKQREIGINSLISSSSRSFERNYHGEHSCVHWIEKGSACDDMIVALPEIRSGCLPRLNFIEMPFLYSPTSSINQISTAIGSTAVLFVPARCMHDVKLEARIFIRNRFRLKNGGDLRTLSKYSSIEKKSSLCINSRHCSYEAAAAFSRAMTIKYCVPIILAAGPQLCAGTPLS